MARSFDGFLGAVTGATALTRGDLGPAVANASLVGADYASCDAAGTPPQPTRPDSGQFWNMLVEEIQYILDLGDITTPGGVTMDPADNAQLSKVLAGAPGIFAHVSSTGYMDTPVTRVVIGSTGSRASGDNSLVAASLGDGAGTIGAGGDESFVVGCHVDDVAAAGISAVGTGSGVAACTAVSGRITCGGDNSLALASRVDNVHLLQNSGDLCVLAGVGSDAAGTGILTGATRCIAAGSLDPRINAATESALVGTDTCEITAGAFNAVILGAEQSEAGGVATGIVASTYARVTAAGASAAVIASSGENGHRLVVSGTDAAAIGCHGDDANVSRDRTVMLASDGAVPAPAAAGKVYGGSGGARTWSIDSVLGGFYSLAAGGGTAASAGAFNMGAADFAEYFVNTSGVAAPHGSLVSRRRQSVQLAQPGDHILGVVTHHPGLVGNATEDRAEHQDLWTCVALTGQVEVHVDGTITNEAIDACEAAGKPLYVRSAFMGVGTLAIQPTRIEAMEVVRPGICMCLVR